MIPPSFTLTPFLPARGLPAIEITGSISRRDSVLSLRYEIWGDLGAIALPQPVNSPARRYGLWEATCFEFFLAPKNSPQYWEFNLSPGGCWNVFSFQGYRQGMQEDRRFVSLPFNFRSLSDSLHLHLDVDLAPIIPADQALEAAVSAIIVDINGRVTYWALAHPGPQPDFHRRDSFIIEL